MMRRATFLLLLVTLPAACVIDGVPLPDETNDNRGNEVPDIATGVGGVFATRSSGVTLVFGVPASVATNATVTVVSGSQQAKTTAAADGSFNIALSGELATTITVTVLVNGTQVASTVVDTPAATLFVPAGSPMIGADAPAVVATTARVDAATTTVSFPAGAFASNVAVAIADIARGTTETAVAASDGSLVATVAAAPGDTLYVVALATTGASAPYVVTVP